MFFSSSSFKYPIYTNVMISSIFLVISCERCSPLLHFIHAQLYEKNIRKMHFLDKTHQKIFFRQNRWKKKTAHHFGPFIIIFSHFLVKNRLTLTWLRYFYSRWCPRGVPWNPLKKTTFPQEFCNEICTIYVWTIKNHNSGNKFWKCCTVSKWRPNNRFLFRVISILSKIWKTTFPKEFFN